jgi:hypothetical protein
MISGNKDEEEAFPHHGYKPLNRLAPVKSTWAPLGEAAGA